MVKRVLRVTSLILLAAVACKRDGGAVSTFNLAFVTEAGGVGDKGRNDMIWRACQRFVEEAAVTAAIDCREPTTYAEGRVYLDELCRDGADVIVVASSAWEPYILALGPRYPATDFIIVGGRAGGRNVKALSYPVGDGGYLMGVAAAAAVPGGGYAFLGGRPDTATKELAAGYRAGVRATNVAAAVATAYVGPEFGALVQTERAGALARELFDGGAAVIFAAAGPANVEVAAVAKERDKLVIGYESNQNYLERGYVITSLNVRWDKLVFEELSAVAAGTFRGGVRRVDIASDYISYPIDVNNRGLLSAAAIRDIEAARQDLANSDGRGYEYCEAKTDVGGQ